MNEFSPEALLILFNDYEHHHIVILKLQYLQKCYNSSKNATRDFVEPDFTCNTNDQD